MPLAARLFVRASLIWLVLGFTLGAALLAAKASPSAPWQAKAISVHHAWVLLGFLLQLTLGTAYWIMPRFGTRRGVTWLAVASFLLINAALIVYTSAVVLRQGATASRMQEAAATALVAGAAAYLVHMWPRVRELVVQKRA